MGQYHQHWATKLSHHFVRLGRHRTPDWRSPSGQSYNSRHRFSRSIRQAATPTLASFTTPRSAITSLPHRRQWIWPVSQLTTMGSNESHNTTTIIVQSVITQQWGQWPTTSAMVKYQTTGRKSPCQQVRANTINVTDHSDQNTVD